MFNQKPESLLLVKVQAIIIVSAGCGLLFVSAWPAEVLIQTVNFAIYNNNKLLISVNFTSVNLQRNIK